MIRTVIDTNIVISAIFWGGLPSKLLKLVYNGEIAQYASPQIIDEYEEICSRIGNKIKIDYRSALDLILRNLILISPVKLKKQICEDPDDDIFIACALAANASYIVSGDKLLLKVKSQEFEVITVGKFMKIVGS